MRSFYLFAGLFAAALGCAADRLLASDQLNQQVRSLLSNRCFACHGPDAAQRQGGFRLDDRQSYLAEADSGQVPVVVGDLEQSELWIRVQTDDADLRMPPPTFGAALTATEKDLLKRWIDSGAQLPAHWSFIPPTRPALPELQTAQVATHPIDSFVLQAMQQRGFQPSPRAQRYELLRRLSLDLTGLPPTPQEVQTFEGDNSPLAYERQVDRLLSSPAFGEHWARKWLDLARYADSAGYADDPDRTIWAYRDWVVRALNANMPIDQFTIEQLAGDLLPNPTVDQLTATAFHRNTLTNNEGGTNDEEFRNVAVVDRVNTTMAVWMGLTFSCAQCHSHKYDPFSHEDYFRLFAIFNQSQDADRRDESPVIELFSEHQLQQLDDWRSRLQAIHAQLTVSVDSPELAAWEASLESPQWQRLVPAKYQSSKQSDAVFREDHSLLVKPVAKLVWADTQTVEFQLPDVPQAIQAIGIRTLPDTSLGIQASQPGADALPVAGLGNGNFVLTDVRAELLPRADLAQLTKFVRVELTGAEKILSLAEVQIFAADETNIALTGKASQSSTAYDADAQRAIDGNTKGNFDLGSTTHTQTQDSPWWEVELDRPSVVTRAVVFHRTDNDLQSRSDGFQLVCLDAERKEIFRQQIKKVKKSDPVEIQPSKPIKLRAAYAAYAQSGFDAAKVLDGDNKSGWAIGGQLDKSHLLSLIPEQPVDWQGYDRLRLVLSHQSPYQDHILASFAVEISYQASARDWAALSEPIRAIQQTAKPQRSPAQQEELAKFFAANFAASTADLRREAETIQQQIDHLKPATSVPIMRELAANDQRVTRIHLRGDYKSLGDEVKPGTPAVFHPLEAASATINRLDLARWLVDRRNPLTARVWVNRLWESLFGLGIVRTSEEFGAQGDAPSHPELLDWLAVDFMDRGWDLKGMLWQMVTSQTYQQTSKVTAERLSLDRDNIWLSRGPRVRMSAEMVRDAALSASGLLADNMFGPPVQPPQPSLGLNAAFGSSTDWSTSQGQDRYRRAIYTKWRRSNPYPSMATFDAPSREVCVLRRDVTNTPLQALVTLNDPVFVEAAQALARRVVLQEHQHASASEKLDRIFQLLTGRLPVPSERETLLGLLQDGLKHFESRLDEATKLASDPLGPLPEGASATELAAWTAVCNVVMNLDEVLMKR